MHYPQGEQDIHAGTAPFDSRERREGEGYEGDAQQLDQQLEEAEATGEEEEDRSGRGPRGLFGEIFSTAVVRRCVNISNDAPRSAAIFHSTVLIYVERT